MTDRFLWRLGAAAEFALGAALVGIALAWNVLPWWADFTISFAGGCLMAGGARTWSTWRTLQRNQTLLDETGRAIRRRHLRLVLNDQFLERLRRDPPRLN